MKRWLDTVAGQGVLLVIVAVTALVTLVFDLSMALGVAGGVPYVLAVLLSLGLRASYAVLYCAAAVSGLVVVGYFASPPLATAIDPWVVEINRGLALFAIWTAAVLGWLQRRASERAAAEHSFSDTVLNTTDALVVVIDRAGTIVRFNAACERLTGYTAAQVLGRPVWTLLPESERGDVQAAFSEACAGAQPFRKENHWLSRTGERCLIEWSNAPLYDDKGRVTHVVGTGIDVTEKRAAVARAQGLQDDLYRLARIGEMGEMASAIAHELAQPLTAVGNYVRAARRLLQGGSPQIAAAVDEALRQATDQAERSGHIIHRMRRLMQRGESEMLHLDLNAAVRDACQLALLGTDAQQIAVEMKLDEDLPVVYGDITQIQQVVINLVRNAVDALSQGPDRRLAVSTAGTADGGAELRVADSGPGLAPDVAERVFMPFVSSKSNGIGIGLSICRSIVHAHNGTIRAEPRPEGGMLFAVTLPAADTAQEACRA